MSNLILVIVCLLAGVLLRTSRRLPATTPAALNGFVIHLSLPAATLLYLHGLKFDMNMLLPVFMAWILFILGALFFRVAGKALGWSIGTVGALILTGAMSNTSFVGFPLLLVLYGPEALKVGILTDQPGSFLVLSTLGLLTASLCSSGEFLPKEMLRRILNFPPFYALVAAFLLSSTQYPPVVTELLEKLSATLVPLSLLSVGFQLDFRLKNLSRYSTELMFGLAYKLLLGPLLIALFFVGLLGAHGQTIEITIVQAAMAPMITGAIVANEYELEPGLAHLMIGIGIPLSLLTVPLWAVMIRGI
ncbi:MAG: transporter [Bdellovibrionales bacterium GWB1_52_6]|nr:MAG: transporter [Bdellovibrionales bacterium GWB1_52_6]OFZ05407.1 MAG: transporter [Bdellovibrionales bacterium GWA1_52_35]HCM41676.1 transporter [Bdellovibrionales bacterium]